MFSWYELSKIRQTLDKGAIKNYLDKFKLINLSAEPIEDLVDRDTCIQKEWLNGKQIWTCNFDYKENDFVVHQFPLTWAFRVNKLYLDKNIVKKPFKPKKQFITLIWTDTAVRKDWYKFIKNYLNNAYYNFNFLNVNNLRETQRWKNLPKEYFDTIWEFGIESGSKKQNVCYQCMTEKTFRPLFFGKPFLVFGAPGMYKKLNSFGISLSPHIDYTFDKDVKNRWRLFCIEVKKLLKDKDYDKHLLHAKKNQIEFEKMIEKYNRDYHIYINGICNV
jgi:hypothetical protein